MSEYHDLDIVEVELPDGTRTLLSYLAVRLAKFPIVGIVRVDRRYEEGKN